MLVVDAVVLVLFRATTRVCTRSKQSLGHGRSCGTVNCFFIAAVCACFRAQSFDTICFHISRLFSNLFLSFSSAPKSISVLGFRFPSGTRHDVGRQVRILVLHDGCNNRRAEEQQMRKNSNNSKAIGSRRANFKKIFHFLIRK